MGFGVPCRVLGLVAGCAGRSFGLVPGLFRPLLGLPCDSAGVRFGIATDRLFGFGRHGANAGLDVALGCFFPITLLLNGSLEEGSVGVFGGGTDLDRYRLLVETFGGGLVFRPVAAKLRDFVLQAFDILAELLDERGQLVEAALAGGISPRTLDIDSQRFSIAGNDDPFDAFFGGLSIANNRVALLADFRRLRLAATTNFVVLETCLFDLGDDHTLGLLQVTITARVGPPGFCGPGSFDCWLVLVVSRDSGAEEGGSGPNRYGQSERCKASRPEPRTLRRALIEDVANPLEEAHVVFSTQKRGERGPDVGQPLARDVFQGLGIFQAFAGGGDRQLVGTEFTFDPQPSREPPDGRVIEQDGLDKPLQEIHPEVAASEVGKFVGDHRLEHAERHLGDPGSGDEHQGTEEAEGECIGDVVTDDDERGCIELQTLAEAGDEGCQVRGDGLAAAAEPGDAQCAGE